MPTDPSPGYHSTFTRDSSTPVEIRFLGMQEYEPVWSNMQAYTRTRTADSRDEIWLLQHPPVFTLGLNAKSEHIHDPGNIPLVQIDRGGQVTYHGPGQLVVYLLLDLSRLGFGVRQLVDHMEQSLIDLLGEYNIDAYGRCDAPGVYVNKAKIAALGLRIRHGCSYHGLALNVDMDLAPFKQINPCGFPDLAVTQLSDLGVHDEPDAVGQKLLHYLLPRVSL